MAAEARAERRHEVQAFKRQTIVEAARRVLARAGTEGLTMRAVASESGYAVGAVYGYFDSKAALLAEIALADLTAIAREMRAHGRSPAQRALAAGQAIVAAPGLLSGDGGGLPPETARALTGKLIGLFQAASGPLGLERLGPEEGGRRALALAAAAIGLATLGRAGQLERLGLDGAETLETLIARLAA